MKNKKVIKLVIGFIVPSTILIVSLIILISVFIMLRIQQYGIQGYNFIEKEENRKEIIYVLVNLGIELAILVTILILKGKKIKPKQLRRNFEDILPPALAEYIIDSKNDLGDMMMSTLLDLVIRDKIKIIDNNKLCLIDESNLEDYELKILEVIFDEKHEINIGDLKEIFVESYLQTGKIYTKVKEIQEMMLKKMYELNLFSNRKKKIALLLKCLLIAVIANFIIIKDNTNFGIILFLDTLIVILAYCLCVAKKEEKKRKNYAYEKSMNVLKMVILFLASITIFILSRNIISIVTVIIAIIVLRTKPRTIFDQKGQRRKEKSSRVKKIYRRI